MRNPVRIIEDPLASNRRRSSLEGLPAAWGLPGYRPPAFMHREGIHLLLSTAPGCVFQPQLLGAESCPEKQPDPPQTTNQTTPWPGRPARQSPQLSPQVHKKGFRGWLSSCQGSVHLKIPALKISSRQKGQLPHEFARRMPSSSIFDFNSNSNQKTLTSIRAVNLILALAERDSGRLLLDWALSIHGQPRSFKLCIE